MSINVSLYISIHTTPSVERKAMFHNCLMSVRFVKTPVWLVYDEETEQENIDYYLKLFPKGGLLKAYNIKDTGASKLFAAIKHCNTKYMAFLQDDDYWYPGRMEMIEKVCKSNEFALLITPTVFCSNGIPTGSLGLYDKDDFYLTPPSKWVINVALAKNINDIPSVPIGWDHAFAYRLCSLGKLLFAEMFPIVYNFSNYNTTAQLDKVDNTESLKKVKDYEDKIVYEKQYYTVEYK